MAESISSALNLSLLFKGIPSCKRQSLAEKMHKIVALFSLIDLRSSDADSDKHIPLFGSAGAQPWRRNKGLLKTVSFFKLLCTILQPVHTESCATEQLLLAQTLSPNEIFL